VDSNQWPVFSDNGKTQGDEPVIYNGKGADEVRYSHCICSRLRKSYTRMHSLINDGGGIGAIIHTTFRRTVYILGAGSRP